MSYLSTRMTNLLSMYNRKNTDTVVVCAETAMAMQGVSHYAYLSSIPVFVECPSRPLEAHIFAQKNSFTSSVERLIPITSHLFSIDNESDFITNFDGVTDLWVSKKERAILETTHKTLNEGGMLQDLYYMVEMLHSIDCNLLDDLLGRCVATDTVRVFVYLCEKADHNWIKAMNPKNWLRTGPLISCHNSDILEPDYNIRISLSLYNENRYEPATLY